MPERNDPASLLFLIFNAVKLWLVRPLVFLTLLFDEGRIKRGLIRSNADRYFELPLTIIEMINEALDHYLRGTTTDCFWSTPVSPLPLSG